MASDVKEQLDSIKTIGIITVVLLAFGVGAIVTSGGLMTGNFFADQPGNQTSNVNGDVWSNNAGTGAKAAVGLKFPSAQASETYVLVPKDTEVGNWGDAEVTSIGADADDTDKTELFKRSDVKENEDYYLFSPGSTETARSELPDSGSYKMAVIGSGIVNTYTSVDIPETVKQWRIDQGSPLQIASGTDVYTVAAAGAVSSSAFDDIVIKDGTDTVGLSTDFSTTTADADVDGTVTGTYTYQVPDGSALALSRVGLASGTSVNGNVSEVTVTVSADGERVGEVSDTDFSDGDGLDSSDGVKLPKDGFNTATDQVTIEVYVDFDDSAITSSTALATPSVSTINGGTQLNTALIGY